MMSVKIDKEGAKIIKKAKPSELIALALDDLKKAEQSKKYTIDMDFWHGPTFDTSCSVCLAGAVIAGTLKVPFNEQLEPWEIEDLKVANRMVGLDSFRCGCVFSGLDYMGRLSKKTKNRLLKDDRDDMLVRDYADDKGGFKRDMRKVARYLESIGL